jgi:hypothetical protein
MSTESRPVGQVEATVEAATSPAFALTTVRDGRYDPLAIPTGL